MVKKMDSAMDDSYIIYNNIKSTINKYSHFIVNYVYSI